MSFDILITAITLFFIIRGWIKGFIEEALNLILIILTIYLSIKLNNPVSQILNKLVGKFYFNKLVGFIILILGFSLISLILRKYLIEPLKKIKFFVMFDKILGVCTGIIISVLITFGISYFVMFFLDPVILQKSKIFPYYDKVFKFLLQIIQNEII